jgi:hypothetical protein
MPWDCHLGTSHALGVEAHGHRIGRTAEAGVRERHGGGYGLESISNRRPTCVQENVPSPWEPALACVPFVVQAVSVL